MNRIGRVVKEHAGSLLMPSHHAGGEEMNSGECESEGDRAGMG